MKHPAALLLAGLCLTSTVGLAATTDDVKWINQCLKDNKGEAAEPVVLKYCTCMNNKMSENETLSITAWEKTHPPSARPATRKPAGNSRTPHSLPAVEHRPNRPGAHSCRQWLHRM